MTRYAVLNALLHCIIFFLGAGIGSFLNVVIYRLPRGLSVNRPRRSFCPSCEYQIPFYHNLPLISWLLLRGRCANCKARISARYFWVELLVAVLFYAVFIRFGGPWTGLTVWGPEVLVLWVFVALVVAGTFIDIEHFILPHEITLGGTVLGLIGSAAVPVLMLQTTHWNGFLMSLGSAALGLGLLWLVVELGKLAFGRKKFEFETPETFAVEQPNPEQPPIIRLAGQDYEWDEVLVRASDRMVVTAEVVKINDREWREVLVELRMAKLIIKRLTGELKDEFEWEDVNTLEGRTRLVVVPREAMGFGDVLFLMMFGSFLGWKAVLFSVLAASVLGTVVAVLQRLTGRAEWSAKIPFGPYLGAGALIWLFWGPQLVDWYLLKITRGAG
ncbi:MAG: prepilin peptidase [Verrucomicrobiales bacterium]|nr:prepilin peptidase [Verrucomicrobiales bacterium]